MVRGYIATSMADYVRKASELGSPANIDRLRSLRAMLRPKMEKSSLCDGGSFTANLQALYYRMWGALAAGTKLGSAPSDCTQRTSNFVPDGSCSITAPPPASALAASPPRLDSRKIAPVALDPSRSWIPP